MLSKSQRSPGRSSFPYTAAGSTSSRGMGAAAARVAACHLMTMTSEGETRTAIRTCPLCEAGCGLEITMRGDEVVRIRGDREDVFSHGFICPKARP